MQKTQYADANLACVPDLLKITTHLRIGGKLDCQAYWQLVV